MKKILYSLVLFGLSFVGISNIKAGSLSISSASSVNVGGKVAVTVKASGLAGSFAIKSSNSSVLSGGTGSTWIDDGTQTFSFSAASSGTATITVQALDVADYDGNPFSGSKSVTITVKNGSSSTTNSNKQNANLSSNNYLYSLGVDGLELSPAFNKDNLEYTVTLDAGTTSININATVADSKATITGNGVREVVEGANKLEVVVTAQNGATRIYTIVANVKEYDPINVKVNNGDYTILRKKTSLEIPKGYVETTVKINDNEIPAYKSDATKYTLVVLKDKDGNENFYVYKDGKYTLYKEYSFNKITLYPIKLSKKDIPKGYSETKIKYNDSNITVYKLNNSSKYALIYGLNVETGEKHIYMYDSNEDTLQIYNDEEINSLNKKLDLYLKVILGASVLIVILIFLSIMLFVKYSKIRKFIDKKIKPKKEVEKGLPVQKE